MGRNAKMGKRRKLARHGNKLGGAALRTAVVGESGNSLAI
jgi:hypothetical protein